MASNKINKKELLTVFKADLTAAEVYHDERIRKIEKWKAEYNGEKYGNEQDGKSKIVARTIKKQDEWLHPSLLDPFVASQDIVKVTPVTWEDVQAAKQSELLLNYQFCRQFDRYNFMKSSLKVLSIEGTLIVQTGWEYEEEEVEVDVAVIGIDETGMERVVGINKEIQINVVTNVNSLYTDMKQT